MSCSIDSSTIISIAQREEDDTEDSRCRYSIAPDDRERVAYHHDLDGERRESLEKSDDIEDIGIHRTSILIYFILQLRKISISHQ